MANTLNTLYPPVMASTFMPAFICTSSARVLFGVSPYDTPSSIAKVHYSVVNQKTNENALSVAQGVQVTTLNYDEDAQTYYIDIPQSVMSSGEFLPDTYYKVQIRFDLTTELTYPLANITDTSISQYLSDYQYNFSEWSTVTLIYPIRKPKLILKKFNKYDEKGNLVDVDTVSMNKGEVPIAGTVRWGTTDSDNSSETETLQSYDVTILDDDSNVLVKSDTMFTTGNANRNEISCRLTLLGTSCEAGDKLTLQIHMVTKSQYEFTETRTFSIIEYVTDDKFIPTIFAETDDDDGIVNVTITNVNKVSGILYVRRASSVDNFTAWEDFYTGTVSGAIDMTLDDNTVKSMTWYRYAAQFENVAGGLTEPVKTSRVLPQFYDAILSDASTQLALRYNFQITSFRPVVARTKVDTLGGKYPRFVENAVLGYKQFSFSALVSSQEDYNTRFMTKAGHFSSAYRNYQQYVEINDIDEYGDYLWEREFREEVTKWLNNGEVKLFRSMTEGSMCVMITDVSLSPNATLGRRLWTVTATAYEVAPCDTLADLEDAGILDIGSSGNGASSGGSSSGTGGSTSVDTTITVEEIGQVYTFDVDTTNDIVSNVIMQSVAERLQGISSGNSLKSATVRSLKIQFNSDPLPYIVSSTGTLKEVTTGATLSDRDAASLRYGYVIDINKANNPIFVGAEGCYEVPDEVTVKKLYLRKGCNVTLDYVVTYKQTAATGTVPQSSSYDKTVCGRLTRTFEPGKYFGTDIRNRYSYINYETVDNISYRSYDIKMNSWKGIGCDVTPYAVLDIMYSSTEKPTRYVVGEGGMLNILSDFDCYDACFSGILMRNVDKSRQRYLVGNEFVIDETPSTSLPANPTKNTLYYLSTHYIYDGTSWRETSLTSDRSDYVTAFSDGEVPTIMTLTSDFVNLRTSTSSATETYDMIKDAASGGIYEVTPANIMTLSSNFANVKFYTYADTKSNLTYKDGSSRNIIYKIGDEEKVLVGDTWIDWSSIESAQSLSFGFDEEVTLPDDYESGTILFADKRTSCKMWFGSKWCDFELDDDEKSGIVAADVYGSFDYVGKVLRSKYI